MANDININESAILEMLNEKIDYDGGNYKGSGLANYVVDKSGDIMTGRLQIQDAGFDLYTARVNKGTTPSSTVYNGIRFNDSTSNTATAYADTRLGLIESVVQNDGKTRLALLVYQNKPSSTVSAGLYLDVDQNGNKYCDFPKCTTKATTTSSAASNRVAVVVQNYLNGNTWYRVWSDGWIEQGGRFDFQYATQTITFPKAFTTTNYFFGAPTDSKDAVYEKNQITILSAWGSGYAYGLLSWYACGY